MVTMYTIQFLTTGGDESYGQIVVRVQQQGSNSRRVATTSNLVIEEELTDSTEVLAYFGRHDVERATQRQNSIHILDMCIERERAMTLYAVCRRQLFHVNNHMDEVPQTCLVQHSSLRLTGRT